MDIYKLSDKIPTRDFNLTNKRKCDKNKAETSRDAGDFGDRITDIKQGVNNPNRVNIFVNDKYSFSLNIAQVVDFHLKVGMVVSSQKLEELKYASLFGKLYQRALEWVLVRPRSEKETGEYLRRKIFAIFQKNAKNTDLVEKSQLKSEKQPLEDVLVEPSKMISEIIAMLKKRGYLDDRKFSEWYVENRFIKKGVSRKRLEMELMKKGISKATIYEVLSEAKRDDAEEIRKMIIKKRNRYVDKNKLMQYLCRQGFSYELVRELVEEAELEED